MVKSVSLKKVALAVLGGLLGHVANSVNISVWNGVEVFTGSVFPYAVVALFGPWWGGLAAALAGARTATEWGHPFALLLHVVEVTTIGCLLRVGVRLAAGAAIYWLGLGLPLVWAIYGIYLGLPGQFVWMVALVDFLSALIAALVAHLFISSPRLRPLWLWMNADHLVAPNLRSDIFAGTLLVGTVPLFAALLFNGTVMRQREQERGKTKLSQRAASVAACLDKAGESARLELAKVAQMSLDKSERERDRTVVEIGPGLQLLLQSPSVPRPNLISLPGQGEFDLPIERVPESQQPLAGSRGGGAILRVKPGLACPLRGDLMNSVRILIAERESGKEFLSYMPQSAGPPKSGFLEASTLFAAIGAESHGTLQFRRNAKRDNPFQRALYLGGYALSNSGLRVVLYVPVAVAFPQQSRFQMWSIFLVVSAVFASAGFAFWLGRRITAPVSSLRRYLQGIQVDSGVPPDEVSFDGVATELRPLWIGVNDLARRTSAALAKSEESKRAAFAATRQKSEFLATISHEIRTPLNCILGMLPQVRSGELSGEQMDAVALMERSGEYLSSILNNVLDFSRIEQGQLEIRTEKVETVLLLEDAFELLAPAALKQGLEFSWFCSPDVPAFIQTDPLRVRQVLVNVVGNALKFTESGSVEIDVAWTCGADPDAAGQLVCSIRDTGPGISRDYLDHLFQPFWQLNQSVGTPKGIGAGLGLPIVKRILSAMGGNVQVDSAIGEGTTVIVTIPASVAQQRPNPSGMSPIVAGSPSRVQDCLLSHLYFFGCPAQVQPDLPSGPGEGRGLLLEDRLAAALEFDSAGSLQALADHGWKVVIYQTYPRRFTEQDFPLVPGIEFLSAPSSLRKLRAACERLAGSSKDRAPESVAYGATNHRVRILVAEDNPDNRLVINLLLKRLGYEPQIVNDGTAAWSALQSTVYDFAILDLRMPGMDGLTLARRILDELPEKPKLIALTASAFDSDRELCMESGFDTFLAKPLRESDLRRVLTLAEPGPVSSQKEEATWSVKNLASLLSLCGDKAKPMIQTVLEDVGTWLASAILERSREAIADQAHKLAGSAMLIGASGLAGSLKEMERIALEGGDPLSGALATAQKEWELARQELPRFLEVSIAPK